ncbi:MAG: inositol monophosphatase [Planctomycetes bacterium]|nr:inositol monophosphatase [Planctomycetota bacterium]
MPSELAQQLEIAIVAAREAGGILLRHRRQHLEVMTKRDGSLVSQADLASEEAILELLRPRFPDYGLLTEERGTVRDAPDQPCWVVDPLDGTTNYVHGLPFFAVSIALRHHGNALLGVVYLPLLDELFTAVPGRPAQLNARPIRVSEARVLDQALLDVYLDRHGGQAKIGEGLKLLEFVITSCGGKFKNLGSTASILCYVAAGRLDGYLKNGAKIWDVAAGALVLEQAGGRFTDFAGGVWGSRDDTLAASNGLLHPHLLKGLK